MRQDAGFLNSVSCQDLRPTTLKNPLLYESICEVAYMCVCTLHVEYVPTSKHACLKSSMSLFLLLSIDIISTIKYVVGVKRLFSRYVP